MVYTRKCPDCGEIKSLNEFHKDKYKKNGKQTYCKKCVKQRIKKYRQEHKKEISISKGIPLGQNKYCASYLGVVIGERLCKHLFKDVEMMPFGNPGFDFICNKGMRIDVKTSCIHFNKGDPCWDFRIHKNKIADFFILISFDNRIDLNILHMWMVPGKDVNNKMGTSIRPSTIHKWDKWKRDINDAQLCCTTMRLNCKSYT